MNERSNEAEHAHPHEAEHAHPHEAEHAHLHEAEHAHDGENGHQHRSGVIGWLRDYLSPHSHDAADSIAPALEGSREGIHALKVSLVALGLTAVLQLAIVAVSGSVALLADTIHNFGDASTAIPLWIAFSIGLRAASRRYTYGYRRAQDLAGLFILMMIAASAGLAGWQSFDRLLNPASIEYPWWVLLAGALGFAGNEFVARYRIRVGRQIGSGALIADGVHARTDALTSLGVAGGAAGVLAGYPRADAIVGLLISLMILLVLKDTSLAIYRRMMDAVDPQLVDRAEAVIASVAGVDDIDRLRMRWIGHRLHVEADIEVDGSMNVVAAHAIADEVHHRLMHDVAGVEDVTIHVHPNDGSTDLHQVTAHHRSVSA